MGFWGWLGEKNKIYFRVKCRKGTQPQNYFYEAWSALELLLALLNFPFR
jgi:hypothetical protein